MHEILNIKTSNIENNITIVSSSHFIEVDDSPSEIDLEVQDLSILQQDVYRYAIVIEYIGTSFAGSQIQPNARTVQSELEKVLKTIVNSPVKTVFSGRTDAGVHSRGQVVHFELNKKVQIRRFIYALNSLLPEDISISAMSQVNKRFHAQKNAKFRWYRYIINNSSQRSVWHRESLLINSKLDVDAINSGLKYLEGEHDFSSFKSKTLNPACVCTMYKAECKRNGNLIYIDLISNRFLYNMVRTIVGTLLEIGKGNYLPEHMKEVLLTKDRKYAGKTAQPIGLTLMCVGYSDKYNLYDYINKEAHKDENVFSKAS